MMMNAARLRIRAKFVEVWHLRNDVAPLFFVDALVFRIVFLIVTKKESIRKVWSPKTSILFIAILSAYNYSMYFQLGERKSVICDYTRILGSCECLNF